MRMSVVVLPEDTGETPVERADRSRDAQEWDPLVLP